MPPTHMMLMANYAAIPTYTLTVNNGTGSGTYTNGQRVTVTAAAPPAYHTFEWTGSTSYLASRNNWVTTLVMPAGDVTVTATYAPILYPLTVNGGLGSGPYTNGQVVTVSATSLPSAGHAFYSWSGDTNRLANVFAATTTVTIISHPTVLTPIFRPLPKPDNLYMVVDLTTSGSQSVSYRDDVPAGGWAGEYQTNKLVLRKIPAGSFVMGSPSGEASPLNETQHSVTLTKAFYLGLYEVTQAQWYKVKGTWPSFASNAVDRLVRPVERVRYTDIRGATNSANWPTTAAVDGSSFMGQLRSRTSDTAFDLPTEAQWEYACRAGTTGKFGGTGALESMGWYNANSGTTTHPVGQKTANAWGLYDMHGNVAEFCLDWYAGDYGTASKVDPPGGVSSSWNSRIMRGGSFFIPLVLDPDNYCRSAYRGSATPVTNFPTAGLRVARTAEAAYGLTVVNGWVNTGGLYFAGSQISISPLQKPGWQRFLRWEVEPAGASLGGLFATSNADTVVTQPAQAVKVTARYTKSNTIWVR
jgi:formylglycine-generating enzyme required for sulfatase activity